MAKEMKMIDVMLKDPNNQFKAGGLIEGRVFMEVVTEMKLKAIKLLIQGVARVTWDENKSYTKGSSSKLSHKNIGLCLDITSFILGRGASSTPLSPGRHDFPFAESIPAFCPSSFEGQWGRVQYYCKLIIERGFGKSDIEFVKNFTVQGVLDLNTENDIKQPIENTTEAMMGIACCASGPVSGRLSMDRRGFVPAENIPFKVDLENTSSKRLAVRVVLSQQVIYRADKQTKKTNTVIKGITRGELDPGDTLVMQDSLKNIPPIQPTRLGGGCKNIEVKYFITLVAQPTGPGKSLEVPVEIVIGTVPLRKDQSGTPMLTVKAASRGDKSPRPSPRTAKKEFLDS